MSYNSRSPAVKRLMKEAQELAEPTELYSAQPLEDNLFEWHFTIRGPEDTPFHGGIYHGRILLPSEYPMKPPNILLLTPNGRFEVKRKICLSISGYHPESWRPCWSIRTALLAIIGFMPTHGAGAIGSLDFSAEERKKLAKESLDYVCSDCGPTRNILLPLTEASKKDCEEAKNLASQIDFQGEKAKASNSASAPTSEPPAASAPSPSPGPVQAAQMQPFPMAADPSQMAAWSYYPYYYASMAQTMPNPLPGIPPTPNMAAPLSFEQWLLQVKGFKDAASSPETAPPSAAAQTPAPAPAANTEPAEPSEASGGQLRHRKASAEARKEEEKGEEVTASEQAASEAPEEVAAVSVTTPLVEPDLSAAESAEEWPLLSLFVICLLLLLFLLANRFLAPHIFK